MIEVNVKPDGITVDGHAEYAEPGKDIFCAGVTALTQTLIGSIEELTTDNIEYDISPGKANIKFGNLSDVSQTLVDSFFIGVCMIADEFPDYVRVV